MKYSASAIAALAATVLAAPPLEPHQKRQSSGCSSAVNLDASTNVFASYTLHPNSFYRDEVNAAVANMTDSTLATKAAKLADIGTFLWL